MAPIDARKKLEQIKRSKGKNKTKTNVKDLRQLIAKKNKTTRGDDRSSKKYADRDFNGRTTKSNAPRDLREVNRKLAARKTYPQTVDHRSSNRPAQGPNRPVSSTNYNTINNNKLQRPINNGRLKATYRQPIRYYVPPHMQQQQPTYIIAPAAPRSNLAMDNVPEASGASILISNLMPNITQSEIIELFGEVGTMTAVNMINQSTALVNYQNSSDAVEAVKRYHNRCLDGKPMYVNMMPNSTPSTSNVRSRIGRTSMNDNQAVPMQIVLE